MRTLTDSWQNATVKQRDIHSSHSGEPITAGLLRTLSRGHPRLHIPMRIEGKQRGFSNYATCGPPATISIRLALLVIATGGTHG
jgi:hypothetical protein